MGRVLNKTPGFSWAQAIPVYTTNKEAGEDGITMTYSISAWVPFLTMFLVFGNAIFWGFLAIAVWWKIVLEWIF